MISKWVGSVPARISAGTLTLALLILILKPAFLSAHAKIQVGHIPIFILVVLTWMSWVFSISPLFSFWSRLSEHLREYAAKFIFGFCYLFVVPFFSLMYHLFHARERIFKKRRSTSWVKQEKIASDPEYFKRMG